MCLLLIYLLRIRGLRSTLSCNKRWCTVLHRMWRGAFWARSVAWKSLVFTILANCTYVLTRHTHSSGSTSIVSYINRDISPDLSGWGMAEIPGNGLTGSLLPWITMFSQSLIFKGALHLCFAVSERASEIPFCYIMLWLFWESVVIRVLLLWLASWLCYWYE